MRPKSQELPRPGEILSWVCHTPVPALLCYIMGRLQKALPCVVK